MLRSATVLLLPFFYTIDFTVVVGSCIYFRVYAFYHLLPSSGHLLQFSFTSSTILLRSFCVLLDAFCLRVGLHFTTCCRFGRGTCCSTALPFPSGYIIAACHCCVLFPTLLHHFVLQTFSTRCCRTYIHALCCWFHRYARLYVRSVAAFFADLLFYHALNTYSSSSFIQFLLLPYYTLLTLPCSLLFCLLVGCYG